MNLRHVDAEDTMQCDPRIEGRRIGRFVSMTSRRQPPRWFCSVSKASQDNLDPQIALHDLGVVGVVKLQRLSESKDVLLTPVSGQRGSDLRFRGMAAPIAMGGQDDRISFTRNHGADDPHPGLARYVGHYVMELNVHLHQRFLHVLDVRRTVVQQVLALAQIGAQCISDGFVYEWASGKASTRKEFADMLEKAGLTMDYVMAETLAEVIDSFERFDRMLASAEARRNNALREIDRHRETGGASRTWKPSGGSPP